MLVPRILAALLVLLCVPASALACSGAPHPNEPSEGCPQYTHHVWVDDYHGVSFNENGQVLVGAAQTYVAVDYIGGVHGMRYLFSIWWYFEGNGEPGLQRGDEVCDQTNGGERESDVLPC